METAIRNITIPSADGGGIPAYVSVPAVLPAPAVVIVAAVFGVNEGAREWADRYAANGFLTVAPDFFWRTLPGPLDDSIPEDLAKALQRTKTFDREAGQSDIAAVRDFALGMDECNGKWALSGYCFGGRYALYAGAYLGADAVVAFHPSRLGLEVATAAAVTCPTSIHFGGDDDLTPMDQVAAVQTALRANPRAETYVYPGVLHGFTMTGRPGYDEAVSELSFERAIRVLDELKTPR
jgi:carboxymethylenebutenolidase